MKTDNSSYPVTQSEDQLQSQCYQWLHNNYPNLRGCFFSVPNGGTRNKIEAMKLKATGLTAGIPDMLLVFPLFAGFEFKTEKGVLSPAQKKIHEIWASKGLTIHIVRTFSNFQKIILNLVNGK